MLKLRRTTLQVGGAAAALMAAGLLHPLRALAAWNKAAFDAKTPTDAMKSMGVANAADSSGIVIEAPQIAENGAVVPIEVSSNIPGTTSLAVLIEKNPFPLAAKFNFKDGAMPYVKVNVRMGESSNVRVIAEAGGKHFTAVKEVKVTIGGCGG
ncbi:MAG: thiosulfate oxidation carrier protein SoxY [Burkholderiales bacterium]